MLDAWLSAENVRKREGWVSENVTRAEREDDAGRRARSLQVLRRIVVQPGTGTTFWDDPGIDDYEISTPDDNLARPAEPTRRVPVARAAPREIPVRAVRPRAPARDEGV